MAMTMHADVVSIEESLFSGLVEFVVAPAEMGELGIYPRHAPLIARLKAGVVRLKIPHQTLEKVVYVSGGIIEVQPHGVTVLADLAIREKDMEAGKLWDEKRKTEETMKNRATALAYAKLEVDLAKALGYLQDLQKLRHSKKRI